MFNNIGASNILYLTFRLAPFIIVCCFMLQSLLEMNLKGFVYLLGLIFACFVSTTMGQFITNTVTATTPSITTAGTTTGTAPPGHPINPRCNILTLNNGDYLSKIPLSITTFSYTFFYLLVFIINLGNNSRGILSKKVATQKHLNTIIQQNLPTIILFPLLIMLESAWIITNKCLKTNNFISILTAIIVGGTTGVLWAMFITYIKKPELQYINTSGAEVCSQPSKTLYRCKPQNNTPAS